jgi:hypothetical protein
MKHNIITACGRIAIPHETNGFVAIYFIFVTVMQVMSLRFNSTFGYTSRPHLSSIGRLNSKQKHDLCPASGKWKLLTAASTGIAVFWKIKPRSLGAGCKRSAGHR